MSLWIKKAEEMSAKENPEDQVVYELSPEGWAIYEQLKKEGYKIPSPKKPIQVDFTPQQQEQKLVAETNKVTKTAEIDDEMPDFIMPDAPGPATGAPGVGGIPVKAPTPMLPLSLMKKEFPSRVALIYVVGLLTETYGRPPTTKEIAAVMGYTSPNVSEKMLPLLSRTDEEGNVYPGYLSKKSKRGGMEAEHSALPELRGGLDPWSILIHLVEDGKVSDWNEVKKANVHNPEAKQSIFDAFGFKEPEIPVSRGKQVPSNIVPPEPPSEDPWSILLNMLKAGTVSSQDIYDEKEKGVKHIEGTNARDFVLEQIGSKPKAPPKAAPKVPAPAAIPGPVSEAPAPAPSHPTTPSIPATNTDDDLVLELASTKKWIKKAAGPVAPGTAPTAPTPTTATMIGTVSSAVMQDLNKIQQILHFPKINSQIGPLIANNAAMRAAFANILKGQPAIVNQLLKGLGQAELTTLATQLQINIDQATGAPVAGSPALK